MIMRFVLRGSVTAERIRDFGRIRLTGIAVYSSSEPAEDLLSFYLGTLT
jgi:hypothetical protein